MDFILFASIFFLAFGFAPAVLEYWLEAPKQAPEAEPAATCGKCIHCGSPMNEYGQCPNLALSGIERFDRNRFHCGHAEIRDGWMAGVA